MYNVNLQGKLKKNMGENKIKTKRPIDFHISTIIPHPRKKNIDDSENSNSGDII
jgi:hypothetical protein